MRIGVIGCRFNTDRFIRQLIRDKFNINLVLLAKFKILLENIQILRCFARKWY